MDAPRRYDRRPYPSAVGVGTVTEQVVSSMCVPFETLDITEFLDYGTHGTNAIFLFL